MDSNEKLYSIKETAHLLSVGRDSVVRLIKNGHLKAVYYPRMGGRGANVKRQVRRGEIQRFLRENEEGGDEPPSLFVSIGDPASSWLEG
jgi:excisionase family DNA binding protein